jgi:ABC-type nitrate/sulfonate/bicarbonate transport system ATPase subunit
VVKNINKAEIKVGIVLKHIYKSFEKPVFEDFNYIFESGKTTALTGSSGCGKTTLINMILGFEKADRGEILFVKKPVFSVVFQEDRLIDSMSAKENILLNGCDETECDYYLKKFGLYESRNKRASQLSGGMKRRIAIIRALTYEADIYIFDEPFKGIDEDMKEKVITSVCEKIKGKTSLLITHDYSDTKIADKTININSLKNGGPND